MLSRCWLGALLVMAAAFPVPAASPGAVVGRVLDAEGTGLAGVMIQVGREGRPKVALVKTDIRGNYAVGGIPPADDYALRIDFPGFLPILAGPLIVQEGATVHQDILLRSAESETRVIIGGRTLDELETQMYLDAENGIAAAIERNPTFAGVAAALREVESLPDVMPEDVRGALQRRIADVLVEVVKPGDDIILELLRDTDGATQSMAIQVLLNQDSGDWLQDLELRALLQELLSSPADNPALGILTVYVYAGRFDEVRSTALALADSADDELSYGAASVIAWSHEQSRDVAGLRRLFHQSGGVLRQTAAIWLAEARDGPLPPDESAEVIAELVLVMEDASLTADFRGDAIRAAGWFNNEPLVEDALSRLLEPDAWFTCVPAPCRPRHSLTVVLEALKLYGSAPHLVDDLLTLRDRLDLLDISYRSEVRNAIDRILAKQRSPQP